MQEAIWTQVLHVQGNVYMIAGAGGNTTVQAGDSGVLDERGWLRIHSWSWRLAGRGFESRTCWSWSS